MVVGVRSRQRKHAEAAGTVQQAADKNQVRVNLDKPQGKKGAYGSNQTDPGQHGAAVKTVGQAADGPQHDDAAQNGGAHEGGNALGIQSDAGGHDRCQTPESTSAYAGKKSADHAQGRGVVEHFKAQPVGFNHFGFAHARKRHWNQPGRHQHRGQRKQLEGGNVASQKKQLPGTQTHQRGGHVGRKNMPALVVAGLFVEPAFDDDVDADHAHAGQAARQDPQNGYGPETVQQNGDGAQRRQCREGAHVAGGANDVRHQKGADDKAAVISRGDDADGGGRKSFDVTAHTQQRADQAVAGQQQENPQKQGGDGNNAAHEVPGDG